MGPIQQAIQLAFTELSKASKRLTSPSTITEATVKAFTKKLFKEAIATQQVRCLENLSAHLQHISDERSGCGSADEAELVTQIRKLTDRAITKKERYERKALLSDTEIVRTVVDSGNRALSLRRSPSSPKIT